MFKPSELVDEYLLWALTEQGFDYTDCLNASVYKALRKAIEEVGEWIGGYGSPCGCSCACKYWSECEIEIIKEAIFIYAYDADQTGRTTEEMSANPNAWKRAAHSYLSNRGLINYGI